MLYLVARMTMSHCAAIMAAMRILLHREGIVVIMSIMILTPLLCPKLLQMTFFIFMTSLGTKPFAKYAGKFPYVLSS
jgi:hypothetical protein